MIVGALSDAMGYGAAFILPALCYALLCGFAIAAGRAPVRGTATTAALH